MPSCAGASAIKCCYAVFECQMSAGLPVSANASNSNKDVGVHTKVSLNVKHRVVSPARIAERTASPEIRLKL